MVQLTIWKLKMILYCAIYKINECLEDTVLTGTFNTFRKKTIKVLCLWIK